jgi:hypothetical protein
MMNTSDKTPGAHLAPLVYAWLALVMFTLLSLGLGQWFHGATWLPILVAAIVWLKGMLVARQFIELPLAHPFIAWVLRVFIAFTPLALLVTAFFGAQFARWTTL